MLFDWRRIHIFLVVDLNFLGCSFFTIGVDFDGTEGKERLLYRYYRLPIPISHNDFFCLTFSRFNAVGHITENLHGQLETKKSDRKILKKKDNYLNSGADKERHYKKSAEPKLKRKGNY
jgi:hypothetical protein